MVLRSITYGSICTGGGGLDLGFELAIGGAKPAFMVEREAFCAAHLVAAMQKGLMAPAPLWSDARTFNGRPWRGAVDFLIGGIPCQPWSVAGRQKGADDERDLWPAFRRILVQSGAWGCLIENVAGMLSEGGTERVCRDLQRLGYSVEGGLFTAAEVGASHERKRLFILAMADRPRQPDNRAGQSGTGWRREFTDRCVKMADRNSAGLESDRQQVPRTAQAKQDRRGFELGGGYMADPIDGGQRRKGNQKQPSKLADKGIGKLANPVSSGHDRGPHDAQRRPGERNAAQGAGGVFPPGPGDIEGWRRAISARPELLPAYSRHDLFKIAIRNALIAANVDPGEWWNEKGMLAAAVRTLGSSGVQEKAESILRGVVDELESPMDDYRIDRLRMLGNGVVPLQAAYAIRTLLARLAARTGAGADGFAGMSTAHKPAMESAQ